MTNRTAPASRFERMSDVELNTAFFNARRRHPAEWSHPSVQAIRDEMVRRTVAAGRTPGA